MTGVLFGKGWSVTGVPSANSNTEFLEGSRFTRVVHLSEREKGRGERRDRVTARIYEIFQYV